MARMIVIDEPGDADATVAAMLERAGHDVGPTAIGDTTVLNVRVLDRQMIVIEMVGPMMNGLEVIRAARKLEAGAPLYVVAAGCRVSAPEAALRLVGGQGIEAERAERAVWREFMALMARPAATADLAAPAPETPIRAGLSALLPAGGGLAH